MFVWILLNAQWRDGYEIVFQDKPRKLKKGEFFLGTRTLADELGLKRTSVRRALTRLKAARLLTLEAAHEGTVGSVINWGIYQESGDNTGPSSGPSSGPLAAHQRPISGPQQEVKKERIKEKTVSGCDAAFEVVNILESAKLAVSPISLDAFAVKWGGYEKILPAFRECRKFLEGVKKPLAYMESVMRRREKLANDDSWKDEYR